MDLAKLPNTILASFILSKVPCLCQLNPPCCVFMLYFNHSHAFIMRL